jgi:hypothetical protein
VTGCRWYGLNGVNRIEPPTPAMYTHPHIHKYRDHRICTRSWRPSPPPRPPTTAATRRAPQGRRTCKRRSSTSPLQVSRLRHTDIIDTCGRCREVDGRCVWRQGQASPALSLSQLSFTSIPSHPILSPSPKPPTAQSGHMGALHKIGQMYAQGIATARSCTTAVHAFKVCVARRGVCGCSPSVTPGGVCPPATR